MAECDSTVAGVSWLSPRSDLKGSFADCLITSRSLLLQLSKGRPDFAPLRYLFPKLQYLFDSPLLHKYYKLQVFQLL